MMNKITVKGKKRNFTHEALNDDILVLTTYLTDEQSYELSKYVKENFNIKLSAILLDLSNEDKSVFIEFDNK